VEKKILVVDDEEMLRTLFEDAFTSQTMEKEFGKRSKTPDEYYDYLNAVLPKTDI